MRWISMIISGLVAPVVLIATQLQASTKTELQAHIDCASRIDANQGGTQGCLTISRLSLTIKETLEKGLTAEIRFDPFGTPYAPFADLPRIANPVVPDNTQTPLGLVDDYALRWQFRPNLILSLEEINGSTRLPNASGLAFGSRFQDSGWDQTALTALYKLPPLAGVDVRLMIGNGEGENGVNLDPQQFGGLEIEAFLTEGLFLKLGMSYDGNNLGSQRFRWLYGTSSDSQGFATERHAVAFGLNGEYPGLRGLQVALGWQRTRVSDLDKTIQALPTTTPFNEQTTYDVNNVLVESPTKANQVQRTVLNFGLSYRILDVYHIGLDVETRQINTDDVAFFEACSQIKEGNCEQVKGQHKELQQNSLSFGVGKELVADRLKFMLEYNTTRYDRLYRYFNYQEDGDAKSQSRELINARVSYQW
jgi:hypothetical protein